MCVISVSSGNISIINYLKNTFKKVGLHVGDVFEIVLLSLMNIKTLLRT